MTQPRRSPPAPKAPVKPDAAMETLLKEVYAPFNAEFSYAVDEVTVTLPRDRVPEACAIAKNDPRLRCDYLRCLAVTEYPDYFQVAYMLYSMAKRHKFILKANAPKDDPTVPTVTGVWKGADWHEREGAELFGVAFSGHPNPKPLLLFEEFAGTYPLRKDYPFQEVREWTEEMSEPWKLRE